GDHLVGHERVIAGEDDHRAAPLEPLARGEHGGPGALALLLPGDGHTVGQPLLHAVAGPHDADDLVGAGTPGRVDHPTHHRLAGRIRCPVCGVATTDPWPTPEELERAYADWYRPERGRFSGPGDALLRRSRGALAGRLDQVAPSGRVLDVGAGDGTLVDALK